MLKRLEQPGRGERGVHQQRNAVLMGHSTDGGDIEHLQAGVAHGLAKEQLGVGSDGRAPAVDIARFDEGGLDAKAPQRVVQQVLRAAVEHRAGHDVRACAHQRADGQVQRCLAAGHGDCAGTAFERRHALLQHRIGGVADARIDMATALHVEERRRMVTGLEDEGRCQVDGHGACAGGGVGRGACVQGQCVKAGIGITGHEYVSKVYQTAGNAPGLWAIFDHPMH